MNITTTTLTQAKANRRRSPLLNMINAGVPDDSVIFVTEVTRQAIYAAARPFKISLQEATVGNETGFIVEVK
jgi:hypothetical protein